MPETDDDAVRIMTIHGAKGLEFPIVVCSGMTTAAQAAGRGVEVLFPPAGGYEVKIVKGVQTVEFELHKPIDEQMGFHEKLRLLYVACTRARDHLVVSVHRKVRTLNPDDRPHWTHAELLWDAAQTRALDRSPRPSSARPGAPVEADTAADRAPGLDPDAWQAEYDRAHCAREPARVRVGHHAGAPPRRRHRSEGGAVRPSTIPASPRTRATSSCRRGTRVGTAPRSAGRCTAPCRPSTSRPARASTPPRPRRPRPKACSATRRRSPTLTRAAIASPTVATRRRPPVLAGDLRGRPVRRDHARGLRRPRVPRRRRDSVRRRLQDRRGRRRDPRRARTGTTGSRPPRTRWRSAEATGEPVVRGGAVLPRPRGRDRDRVRGRPTSPPRWPRSERCSRPSATSRRPRRRSCPPTAERRPRSRASQE